MPTSSQFNIIDSLEQKLHRRQTQVYDLPNSEGDHKGHRGIDGFYGQEAGVVQDGKSSPAPNGRTVAEGSSSGQPMSSHSHRAAELFPPMSLPVGERSVSAGTERSTSALNAYAGKNMEHVLGNFDSTDLSRPPPGSETGSAGNSEDGNRVTSKSDRLTLFTPDTKKRLYCLGFRGLPGEKAEGREKIKTILKLRPGIAAKLQSNAANKEAVVDLPESMQMNTDILLDFSSVDPKLLRPTALCFDATGLDITHQELKRALDRILMVCPGVRITKIQYEIRKLKDPLSRNRWMIYTESTLSRNLLSGRQLKIEGQEPIQLRRYDDLVLLEVKQEKRANAWKDIMKRT